MTNQIDESAARRRGRPPASGPRELEVIALRLFVENGFDATTVDDIASEAGIGRRTFHRYFANKADVLWHGFDQEVLTLRDALAATDPELPLLDAIRSAVLSVNRYTADDVPELRSRMELIGSVMALQASAAAHYDAWEEAVADFVATRTGQDPNSLYPLAIGRTMLAACRTAYDIWIRRGDADLIEYLDAAIRALGSGFDQVAK